MRRGDIWTTAGSRGYMGKPRPAVIIQDDRFDATDSVTICAFTTDPTPAPLMRLPVEPDADNGLDRRSSLMVDKITTASRSRLCERIGSLAERDMTRLGRALVVFVGLAGSSSPKE
ncbi:type II toxin-antitoxin system PemK/MazF family toxin [Candidatus Poriferisodalis sp.]|uniref:type II toxin-antitoxin system PemK/MazF family toxin n=1 Tax=Candidatus Poriferisodalis sp. TaxID=3101277 RepID=UPI003B012ACB